MQIIYIVGHGQEILPKKYTLLSVQSQTFLESSDISPGKIGVESCLPSLLILQVFVMQGNSMSYHACHIMQGDSEFREESQ